jgi:hypothetical protein
LGYAGHHWQTHWQLAYQACVLTQNRFEDQANRAQRDRQLPSMRQVVEEVNHLLSACSGLAFPRAHTSWGLLMRLAAKIAACTRLRWLNHLYARPALAHFHLSTFNSYHASKGSPCRRRKL